MFYLKDNIRERIIKHQDKFSTHDLSAGQAGSRLTTQEIIKELHQYPERFSPNVILRGLYQETILPNIAYIGGGGEVAYWLQLKALFEHYKVSFPVLLLRNSFLIIEKKWQKKISKLGFSTEDFFLPELDLINRVVENESKRQLKLNGTFSNAEEFYNHIKEQVASIDSSLAKHVEALKVKSLHQLHELEKKMLRAEKRKFTDQQRQIKAIKKQLFPANGLQERYDNMLYYYAKWGKDFISKLYEHSLNLEQEFVLMQEK